MDKHAKPSLPEIAYLMAVLVGLLLFLIFSETVFGIKPNLVWIAMLTGFLFSCAIIWAWINWRKP